MNSATTSGSRLALLGVLLLLMGARPAGAAPAISVGDLRATLSAFEGAMPSTGLRVTYRGLPLITRSSLNVASPEWATTPEKAKVYFTLGRARAKVTPSNVPGGKRLTFVSTGDAFDLTYTVDLLEGNRILLDARGTLHSGAPAVVEYAAGYLSAVLAAGQPFSAATAEGERTGVMPFSGLGTEFRSATVLPPFNSLRVAARIGTITVAAAAGDPGLDLFDARKIPSPWLQESPIFWLGHLAAPLAEGKRFHSHVEMTLAPVDPSAQPQRPVPTVEALTLRDVPDVRLPSSPDGPILPAPREMRAGRGSFRLDGETRIVVGEDAASRRAARELQERLREEFGLRVRTAPAPLWRDRRNVIVVASRSTPCAREWISETGLSPVVEPEGYALRVTPRSVLLAGADARGTLYGVFTLLQMARGAAGDGGPEAGLGVPAAAVPPTASPRPPSSVFSRLAFPAATVRDWPATPVRAVHLLTDHWSIFLHRDLIRNVLAPNKINTILLECEYVKWDSHPELHVSWSMPKEEVRALLALARDYNIEVIPLVQTLGHMGWMFANNQHLDLAEDPQAKYVYCPSNPKAYDLIFDVLSEALELFGHPRTLHIGHDEFHHRGKVAEHEPCKGKSITDLFLQDTLKLQDWLAKRGVRTMMWGDMLLGPGEAGDAANADTPAEARLRRERLPKEILVADWHYAVADDYPSIRILRAAGFEVWGATWHRPENILGFARAASEHGTGLIQTTWTGYYGNITALRREPAQFWGYVLAAAYAWNPSSPPLSEAVAAAPGRFLGEWPALPRSVRATPGFVVDLSPLGNMPWGDTPERDGWLGFGPEHDLSALEEGGRRLGTLRFDLPAGRKAIALRGALLPARCPESVRVPIGRRAGQLLFLMATGWEVGEGKQVGQIRVHYADGTDLPVGLIYGGNIRAAHDARPAVYAPVVWEGRARGGEPLYLRAYTLWNPFPAKEIAAVELASEGTEAAPILFGLSGTAVPR